MTDTPVPDAAVQIATEMLDALARAGWLHGPAEVATLRAVADTLDALMNHGLAPDSAMAQIWATVNPALPARETAAEQ